METLAALLAVLILGYGALKAIEQIPVDLPDNHDDDII